MKLLFLGDSITCGVLVQEGFVDLVAKELRCEVKNYGKSGTRIAKQMSSSDDFSFDENFLMRAKTMDKNADFVIVFGGTNDYGHGDAVMGKLGEKKETTFLGALQLLFEYLQMQYGKEKLCFILPLPRFDMNNIYGEQGIKLTKNYPSLYSLQAYIQAEKTFFESQGVNYLDLSLVFTEPNTAKESGLFVDGIHPNQQGHRLIAKAISDYIKKKNATIEKK